MINTGEAFWAQIKARYLAPPRHYHTFDHVRAVLLHYGEVRDEIGWKRPVDVWLAIVCHDAVYQVGRDDNEKLSAEFAVEMVAKYFTNAEVDPAYVSELIELTARHGRLRASDVTPEQSLFVDCDMAILGASSEQFAAFERGVEAEYTEHITSSQYAAGRQEFLQRLLDSDRIYLSPYFHDRLDQAARKNIAQQLAGEPE